MQRVRVPEKPLRFTLTVTGMDELLALAGAPVLLEHRPCPMGCANAQDEIVIVAPERLHNLPGKFTVVRCNRCGLMRTDPRPTPETMGYFYPRNYAPHQRRPAKQLTVRDRIAGRVHRLLNAWRIPNLAPGRLIEFGCGPGSYLLWMANQGWEVAGIETSHPAGEVARSLGFPVHIGPLETAPAPQTPYDLCVGWMVLEHLHDPIRALRNLADWSRDDGWLAISLPNAASKEFSLFGDSWFALQVPTHLYHFTPATITALLKKGGWKQRRIFHQRNIDNLIASCGHLLENNSDRRIFKRFSIRLLGFPANVGLHFLTYPLLFPIACILAALGQTGRMTVLAQKAE